MLTAGAIVLPIVSGTSVRAVKSGAKAVKKPAKKVVKAAFKKGKKTAGKAVKDLGQKAGTGTGKVKDTGKRVADGFHEAGKKMNKTGKENGKIELDHGNGVKKSKGGSGSKVDNIKQLIKDGKVVDNNMISSLDDNTQVIFRNDTGNNAHQIKPKGYFDKVDHYNVEIQTKTKAGKWKSKWSFHIIFDEKGNIIDTFD